MPADAAAPARARAERELDAPSPRDLARSCDMAVEAEAAGIDTVMLSEHVVLGPSAGAAAIMGNPRDYAAPGNQDPATPWPDSIVLASADRRRRPTRLRIALAAVIAPLRHPLLLAKQLATLDLLAEGRLVVQPTVSLARGRVRRARRAVPAARRDPRRAARGDGAAPGATRPAAFDGEHFALRRRVPRAEAVPAGGAADVVRRAAAARARCCAGSCATATASTRSARRRRTSSRGCARRWRRPAATRAELEMVGGIRGRFADARRDRRPRRGAGRRSPPSSRPATRRSASSRRCTPTTRAEVPALCRRVVALMAEAAARCPATNSVRTSHSSGNTGWWSVVRRYAAPLDPPVPGCEPIVRSTIFTCR